MAASRGGTLALRSARTSAERIVTVKEGTIEESTSWGWRSALAGALLAFAPTLLLDLFSKLSGSPESETATKATLAAAIALLLSSLLLYGWQLTVAWALSLRPIGGDLADWGFRRAPLSTALLVPLGLLGVYLITFVHDKIVHPPPQGITEAFPHTPVGIALFFVVAVLIAPAAEEVFFRGFLFKGFATSWGWLWGAVASATVFAVAHGQLSIFLPLFCLGFTLAWLYKHTGSIWSCIALHALFNGISITAWALT